MDINGINITIEAQHTLIMQRSAGNRVTIKKQQQQLQEQQQQALH